MGILLEKTKRRYTTAEKATTRAYYLFRELLYKKNQERWAKDQRLVLISARRTPALAFFSTERLIGDAAKNQVAMNPSNSVFDAKRLLGRKFNDPSVQSDKKHWSFNVVNDNDKPKIKVEFKGQEKVFTPEEIS